MAISSVHDRYHFGKYHLYRDGKNIGVILAERNSLLSFEDGTIYKAIAGDILINIDEPQIKYVVNKDLILTSTN